MREKSMPVMEDLSIRHLAKTHRQNGAAQKIKTLSK
jgi:hypothetical protein